MKNLILILFAVITSCSNDETPITDNTPYWVNRHDAIPATMYGEWVSITNPEEITLIITDKYVLPEGYHINPKEDNAVNTDNRIYTMYQGGHIITVAFGTGSYEKYLTLTVDNKCIGRFKVFSQSQPQYN